MNVDVGNIDNIIFWGPIYEVIDSLFFAATKLSPTGFLDQCRDNQNKPQFLPSEVKVA